MSSKNKEIPDNFCPVPFTSVVFHPTGAVGGCREKCHFQELGNLKKQSFEEIWNGKEMRSWRKEFLTGNIKTCASEIRDRGCNKTKLNSDLLKYVELSEIQKNPPKRISPNFNGHCNLECPMCVVRTLPSGLYDSLGFWEMAEEKLFPNLTQVEAYSGEPFIQKDTYRMINIMERVNPKASWFLTTNGQWKFTPAIKHYLDKIESLFLHISLDSINEKTYSKLRKGGNLSDALNTIDKLLDYREKRKETGKSFHIEINTLVQRSNWKELPEFVDFVFKKKCGLFVQLLYEPKEYSILEMTKKERIEILRYLHKNVSLANLPYLHRITEPLYDSLPKEHAFILRKELALAAQSINHVKECVTFQTV